MFSGYIKSVMDTVIDGLLVIDCSGTVVAFNPAAASIFGYAAAEVLGHNVSMLMPEPDRGAHDDYMAHYLNTGEKRILGNVRKVAGRRRDGSAFPMEIGVNEMLVGVSRMFVATVRDIAEREAAERHQADDAARMKAVMDTVLDGLITIDERGTIETFNPAASRIFGYRPEEATGQSVKMLMAEPYCGADDVDVYNYLHTGAATVIGISHEVSARRKDGTIFPIELGINEMHVFGKRLFVGSVRDITERKDAEATLQDFIRALSRSNQELDDFAHIASHDLKEPLRGLSNNALFLREDFAAVLGEDGARRLARITFLCERMERLVNDLLYFARLGRQDLAVQQTDLNTVIADIEAMMETSLTEANARIVVPEKLPSTLCDRPRVTEVFRNLIVNAIKYNDKLAKRIEIGWSGDGAARIFHVRDNGIGIDRRFHADVFRIFKRLNEEDDSARGSGVGLTFVKKIIERHGGEIWIDSTPGTGTTFFFSLNKNAEKHKDA